MDRDNSLNIQNDFFNQARKDKARVLVFLNSGKKLTGRIKSFDKFTVILESGQGEQMIFKHRHHFQDFRELHQLRRGGREGERGAPRGGTREAGGG